ncbi:glutamate--tRNA ligase [Candidatus Woesebacteria bacterium]|nr:MAG: glutamate--tRNA ligase [Candidatus Woesebacteria bacterium]
MVRTRFAPSPTGFLHIGSLRTALYAYALAKRENGVFVLRIEDTDQKREVEGSVDALKKTLEKFGLFWDEYFVQSDRLGLYKSAAQKLLSEGHAFYCQCDPKNAKEKGYSSELRDPCRDKNYTSGAVKLLVPENKLLSYYDFVHKKEISWKTDTVYDATLLKSDGFPTYHLAVAVDDLDMKITHILRGHDWMPSTPIHLLVFEYLGGQRPEIGHLTDILSSDTGKKLSKRRDSVFVEQFIDEGYLPEALLNFVMLLGWAPKDNREIYSLTEFTQAFDVHGFQEANPKFLRNKLDWMNGQYMQKLTVEDMGSKISDFFKGKFDKNTVATIVPLIQTRIKTLKNFEEIAGFFFDKPRVDTNLLSENYASHLSDALETFKNIDKWELENINEKLNQLIESKAYKTGEFFMNLRIAITGKKFTPPINESIEVIGKKETIERLSNVLSQNEK